MKTFVKTEKLKEAKFRGQKELVVQALSSFSSPQTIQEIEKVANRGGRYGKLLNEWAQENGGVHGSVLYHLRELEALGMIKVEGEADAPRIIQGKKKKKAAAKKAPKKVAPSETAPPEEELPVAAAS
jgi:hypothetical protein